MLDQEEIYLAYKDKVFGYLMGKVGHVQTAEDLCSEVFVKVFSRMEQYDEQKSGISTWIYTITRNTLYDYFRTRHQTDELDENLAENGDFTESICNEEMLEALADALEKLPERERDLILLRYYQGETLRDIANRFGISYSYAKLLQSNALQKLQNLLGE